MCSRLLTMASALALVMASAPCSAADVSTDVDLKRAAPSSAHMAVYAKHNPERNYQREYLEEVWNTAEEERIGERILKIVAGLAPKEKLEEAEAAWEDVKDALEPINGEALVNAKECVVAQQMEGPFNQTLVALRLTSEDAADFDRGVSELFELAAKWGEDKISVESSEEGDAKITELRLPEESPVQPCIARLDDVAIFSTSPKLLRASVDQLQSDSGDSKFDDPRVKEALKHLPKPEDSLVFFDGRRLWESLGGVGDFIREKGRDDEKAQRVAGVLDRLFEEIAIFDYEVAVEYTEDGQNRVAAMGKLAEGYEEKALGKALTQGEPFEDWQQWVPEDATSYSLHTGVNLHVLYEGIMEFVREEFPEAEEGLAKFEKVQEEVGVNIDEDILQNFSGESVSVTVPVEVGDKETQQGVTALKCENPERIRELLDRAVEGLQDLPALEAQDLELVDSEELDGFQVVQANFFNAVGVKPVIGFQDGWMIVSSHEDAAKKLVEVREGDADSIDGAASLEEFDLKVDGDVYAVTYSDVGAGIRGAADAIDWAGTMAPIFVGMAAAKRPPEDIEALQQAFGLLPSIAKVVRKLDFFEERLSVTHEGPTEGTYIRETVTLIRQPGDEEKEEEDESDE